jgi:hypothetical protein
MRSLWPAYLACLYFAGQPGPHAYAFAASGPAVGFLALAFTLRRLSLKGSAPHV